MLRSNEREAIFTALQLFTGNRSKAAHHLGISERTLYRKIKEYQLDARMHTKENWPTGVREVLGSARSSKRK